MYLYEEIDQAKTFGAYASLPKYISQNLNQSMELRPYQKAAFQNFITYFENPNLRTKPSQTLFHMATGSGKTLIMAGLIIYLYKQGYRHFIFTVHLGNVLQKTRENFLNRKSSKYLFNDQIVIDGETIPVNEVSNFQAVDEHAINICFLTIQKLHDDMETNAENSVTIEDFKGEKTVLISDEAHHLNVSTKKKAKGKEKEDEITWEEAVTMVLQSSPLNVLLEFTATIDQENQDIKSKYENKIVYDYSLLKYNLDGYSKEIMTLRSSLNPMQRSLQALMLSQYRLKVFQEHHLNIKPVILFKSRLIKESKEFLHTFLDQIAHLTGDNLADIRNLNPNNDIMNRAYLYFHNHNINYDELAAELKVDFSLEHCISANEPNFSAEKQILLNSLEDKSNPYRAVFAVDKLNEGWDVLNLFDIVRLYETRQSSGHRISEATIEEAQLIGRGARYCPFQLNADQPKYKRKYDNDINNEMRICETLYYHCYNEHRYVTDLRKALQEIGLDSDPKPLALTLKENFKHDDLYKIGKIFVNERKKIDRTAISELSQSIRNKVYTFRIATGESGMDTLMKENSIINEKTNIQVSEFTVRELAKINYALVYKAIARKPSLKFNQLKSYFPNLKTTREFITDGSYLGDIHIIIKSQYSKDQLSMKQLFMATTAFINKIADFVENIDINYEGTKDFIELPINKIFKDKQVVYSQKHPGGLGYGQNDPSVDVDYRVDLMKEDWYAFSENWGTREEKAFVAYFKNHVSALRKMYDKIYLVRNERQFHLYSFDDGGRFEPDFVIFLQRKQSEGLEQLQIFVEPKGNQLLETDKWKEDFLLQIKDRAHLVIPIASDDKYKIWGLHFYNEDNREKEFNKDFAELLKDGK